MPLLVSHTLRFGCDVALTSSRTQRTHRCVWIFAWKIVSHSISYWDFERQPSVFLSDSVKMEFVCGIFCIFYPQLLWVCAVHSARRCLSEPSDLNTHTTLILTLREFSLVTFYLLFIRERDINDWVHTAHIDCDSFKGCHSLKKYRHFAWIFRRHCLNCWRNFSSK